MRVQVDNQKIFLAALSSLIALCWLILSIWSISPYSAYMNHEILDELANPLSQDYWLIFLVFVLAWTLMVFAMMLPTSLPLIVMFQRLIKARQDQSQLLILLLFGYLSIWIGFGVFAHLGDLLLHEFVRQTEWLSANQWLISASILTLAGLYQFSSLKHLCLEKCRSPFSFITEHWKGHHQKTEAYLLGLHHGLFCLGCCWSLMLLMFALSAGNILWMLLLGMVMATEKNLPWGRQLSKPLGIFLLVYSLLLCILGLKLI